MHIRECFIQNHRLILRHIPHFLEKEKKRGTLSASPVSLHDLPQNVQIFPFKQEHPTYLHVLKSAQPTALCHLEEQHGMREKEREREREREEGEKERERERDNRLLRS